VASAARRLASPTYLIRSMDRIWIGVALLLPFIIGLVKLARAGSRLSEMEAFADEFGTKLGSYIKNRGEDRESYVWLVHRSNKMQGQLGSDGVFVMYRPPGANVQYRNYQIVVNVLPELRRTFEDKLVSGGSLPRDYAAMLQDMMVRHLGTLSDRRELLARSIKNPFIWLREGVRTIIALPVSILGWLGVVSEDTVGRITGGKIFRVVSGIASFVGFVGAVMGIVLGWNEFAPLVVVWWRKFF